MLNDLRFALRMLLKNPGFTTVAGLTLALGIGGTTAIFSVVYGALLNPWPYVHSDRLGVLMLHNTTLNQRNWAMVSAPEWLDFQQQNQVFSDVIGGTFGNFLLTGSGVAEQYWGSEITPNTFRVLGVPPVLGRGFTDEDGKSGAAPVVMLSYKVWHSKFGGDPGIVGRTITLNHQAKTIIGVVPERLSGGEDVYVPAILSRAQAPGQKQYYLQGRLKPGVSFEKAAADILVLAKRFATVYVEDHPKDVTFTVESITLAFTRERRPLWYILLGSVGLLLLIACVNVANLLLARATAREKEIAIRAALGAGRGRLVRQFLIESLVLGLGGAVLGCLLAWNVLDGLLAIIPPGMLPSEAEVRINGPVLLFTLGTALLCTLLFGLAPALHAIGKDLQEPLKASGRGAGESLAHSRLRNLLVVSEVALSLVLLTGGGLLIRNFLALRYLEPGYNLDNVTGTRYLLPEERYKTSEQRRQFHLESLRRIRALPGVVSAAITFPWMDQGWDYPIEIAGKPSAENQTAAVRFSGDRFFETMGIPLLQGRTISEEDFVQARKVAVINRAFVGKYFANENPLGRQVTVVMNSIFGDHAGRLAGFEIIGVVSDTRHSGVEGEPSFRPEVFLNYTVRENPWNAYGLIFIRTLVAPSGLVNPIQREFMAMDRELPVSSGWTLRDGLQHWYTEPRFVLTMLVAFASLGLALVSVGVYSVLSYAVSRRTQEIGIRMALGAEATDVRRMVMMAGLRWLLVGVGIGVPSSIALAKILQNRIWGIKSADPLMLIAVSLLLVSVGLAACYFPARRATKVDPMIALRNE
jgi:putative ABC transport system permease protein